MYYCGIDIGSTTSKTVIIDEDKNIKNFSLIHTKFDRDASGKEVLQKAMDQIGIKRDDIAYIVSTGYGRRSLSFYDKASPEIICHAIGTCYLVPGVKTIIDIGGQDSKVISLDENGMILKFEMNDKCAAGTGRFFEVLTGRLLNVDMDELGEMAMKSENPSVISSMCTIFAESEIISFLSEGIKKEDIAMGMNLSIAKRIIAMGRAGRLVFAEPIVFSGGVANNIGVKEAFERLLKKKVNAIENPQNTGALGAAICALEKYKKIKDSE